jgi:tRNA nucleotidyltransferase/poly(A) polymerase
MRFHSKYPGSKVDPAIIEAMSDPRVHEAYDAKVAPERAGKEIMKMMSGPDPTAGVRLLFGSDMYLRVFDVPEMAGYRHISMDQQNENHKHNLMEHTLEVMRNLNNLMVEGQEPPETRALMNLSSMFHDFGKMHPEIQQPHPKKPEQMQYLGHEDASAEVANSAMKAIGIGKNDRDFVSLIVTEHMKPHGSQDWSNKAIGKFLRNTKIEGQDNDDIWKYIFYHGIADSMSKGDDTYHEDVTHKQDTMSRIDSFIENQQQQQLNVSKPLIDGREIMSLIPELEPKTGFINYVNNLLLESQDAGEITSPEEAKMKVLEQKQQIISIYQGGTTAMNWYRQNKVADASSASDANSGMDWNAYEGRTPNNLNDEIVEVKRTKPCLPDKDRAFEKDRESDQTHYNDVVGVPFRSGDVVRLRGRGMAQKQQFGKVLKIENNNLHIKWDGVEKKQVIPLNQTAYLAHEIERV